MLYETDLCYAPSMLRVPAFRQTTGYCGPACLKMILAYYGHTKSEAALAKLAHSTHEFGTPGERLVEVASMLGYQTVLKDNVTLSDLRRWVLQRKIPVIVNWFLVDEGHYSLVVHLDAKHITLLDPDIGAKRKMPLSTFMRVWFDFTSPHAKTKKDFIVRRMIAIFPT